MVFETHGESWTRKHDDPRRPLFASVPVIAYPQNLAELRVLLANSDRTQRFKAGGSHWSLSAAAMSDGTYVETHDPLERHPAMGRTLNEVVPGCLSDELLDRLGNDHAAELGSLFHVESGKRIYQAYAELDQVDDLQSTQTLAGHLFHNYDSNTAYAGPWAFQTLGGAGGQTVVGALSTGTHGGDFDRGPVSDSVQALHLVVDGGKHYWIEPDYCEWGVPLTGDDKLRAVYGDDLQVLRSDKVFNAALVSVGRFGVIYSVVLRVVRQYALREDRVLRRWEGLKADIKDEKSSLYVGSDPEHSSCRFLQIAVCVTPYGIGDHLAGVTRRFEKSAEGAPGHAERVGNPSREVDPKIGAHRYSKAGVEFTFDPGGDTDPLARLCANPDFLLDAIDAAIGEIEDLVESQGVVIGGAIAYVGFTGGAAALGGLLALLAPLALLVLALRELVALLDPHARLGEVFDAVRGVLLSPYNPDPISGAAGVFMWRLIAFIAFKSQQGDRAYTALSYAVMDQHDYRNISCEVNVDSVEVFFDADGDELIAFVDALLAYEAAQEHKGRAFVGYASLRFTGKTRALLGPQRWRRTASVEVACLRDTEGSQHLVDHAVALALDPNYKAVLHWGQHNDVDAYGTYLAFGQASLADPSYNDLTAWREVLADLTEGGHRKGFSSTFTRQAGLELL